MNYKFLLIEDSDEDIKSFIDTIKRLNLAQNQDEYILETAVTYEEGMTKITEKLNGIIVDIKLDEGHSGNEIIKEIIDKYRVPVAIFTGTPDVNLEQHSPILIYKKGEASHEDILSELLTVSETGLFDVIGGSGIIEEIMKKVFWQNLYPQISLWKQKKAQGIETKKILLRYAVSHIQEYIDNEVPQYQTEEMYIKPPISNDIKTGSIFISKEKIAHIVLSPPCDLAKHNDKIKTDQILVCEIDKLDMIHTNTVQIPKNKSKLNEIKNAIKNNFTGYYHWLPPNALFEGGYINFRKVKTYSSKEFADIYKKPIVKVQEYFVKNILNRFSAYYARQGQPDFDFESEANKILDNISMTKGAK